MDAQNFHKLHVMMLSPVRGGMPSLRTALDIIGITRIVALINPYQALALLAAEHFDAVFCSAAIQVDGRGFAPVARTDETALNPLISIFLVHDRVNREDVERARDSGVTDVLTSPISTRTVIDKLHVALASPKPFISAPDFFGPDRRSRRDGFGGAERRARSPRKIAVAVKKSGPPRS